jgi:4-hydroxybenzoate polyprenyltransferase
MFRRIAILFETVKFTHTVFALPFALLAGFIASGSVPDYGKIVLILGCMVFGRNTAMMFNRIVDVGIDGKNPRTQDRSLVKGTLSRGPAVWFTAVNVIGFIVVCGLFYVWYANAYPVIFSIPVLVYLCGYSYSKRFTWFCHFWLGGSHSIAVWGGFLAIDPGSFGIGGLILGLSVGLWTSGFDIIYSTLDYDFDRRYGIHSLPSALGIRGALFSARVIHAICVIGFFCSGWMLELRGIFMLGVVLTAGMLIYEHRLVRWNELSRVNVAFFNVNGIISIVLGVSGFLDRIFGK